MSRVGGWLVDDFKPDSGRIVEGHGVVAGRVVVLPGRLGYGIAGGAQRSVSEALDRAPVSLDHLV